MSKIKSMLDTALDLIEAKIERLPTDVNNPNHPWNVMFREIHQSLSEERPTVKEVKDDLWDAVHRQDLQLIENLKAQNKALRNALQEALAKPTKCEVPPTGWKCSRAANHEGPCAATACGVESSRVDVAAVNYREAIEAALSLISSLEILQAKEYLEYALKEGTAHVG